MHRKLLCLLFGFCVFAGCGSGSNDAIIPDEVVDPPAAPARFETPADGPKELPTD